MHKWELPRFAAIIAVALLSAVQCNKSDLIVPGTIVRLLFIHGQKDFTLCQGTYFYTFFERFSISLFRYEYLKGLSHEIFGPVYWPV
jgi:hypothetical protein